MSTSLFLRRILLFFLAVLIVLNMPLGFSKVASATSSNTNELTNYIWSQKFPASYPTSRTAPFMAYDPVHKNVLLFGGLTSNGLVNDTWIWDGSEWTKLNPVHRPSPRSGGGMAFDPHTQQMLIYGGDGAGTDTWIWTGSDWQQLTTVSNPGTRRIPYMAADENSGNIVLFGGLSNSNVFYGDTWIWNGADWEPRVTNHAPSARAFGQVAYDPKHKNIVLFGGVNNGVYYSDTWTWDGNDWTLHTLSADHIPPGRAGAGMVYDESRIIMAGGDNSQAMNDTWIWNGNEWQKQTSGSPLSPRGHVGAAYDPIHGDVVVFGGFTTSGTLTKDTWILRNLPIVSTGSAEQIMTSSAVLSGDLALEGRFPVKSKGIEITIDGGNIQYAYPTNGIGSYTIQVADLQPDTSYAYRAYATDYYGNMVYAPFSQTFKTKALPPILLDSYNYNLERGTTHQTVVQSVYEEDNRLFTISEGVTFSSSAPEIASIDEKGLVTGKVVGSTVIKAVYRGMTAEALVNVIFTAPTVTNLSVDSNGYTLKKGDSQQTVTRAVYSNGTTEVMTDNVTYISSDSSVASIDSKGLITAHRIGTTVITIEFSDKSALITVTVKEDKEENNSSAGSTSGGSGSSENKDTTESKNPSEDEGKATVKDPLTDEPIATIVKKKKDDKQIVDIQMDTGKAISSLEKSNRTTLTIPSAEDTDETHAQMEGTLAKWLEDRNGAIELQTPKGRYILPAKQLGVDELVARTNAGESLALIHMNVTVSNATEAQNQALQNAAAAKKVTLAGPGMNFNVSSSFAGMETPVADFKQYAQRLILLPAGYDPNRITTGIIYDEARTSFMHVPTKVIQIDGQYYAQINSLVSSGTYALIWNEKSFSDVTNHWAKAAIDNMASRLVVEGMNHTTFDPNRQITRAEFAAIAVRAFGLQDDQAVGKSFRDVSSGAWYTPYVRTASAYGLLNGYTDGSYQPDKKISRQEAISILIRAARLADINPSASSTAVLNSYKDGAQTSGWAKEYVSYATEKGIMQGDATGMLNSKSAVTRAETASLMERILKFAELI